MPELNEVLHQGRYRVVNHLGQNGTGMLYEAYDSAQSENVLLREIPIKLNKVTTPAQVETLKLAFSDEARGLSSIKHGSLIQVHGHFSDVDRHYLVMEMTDGDYLSDLLEKTRTAFSLSELTSWADQLLEALMYLHSQSPAVIHRDLRPQNVKLTSDGKIKLLALGAAKIGDTKSSAVIANQSFDSINLNYLPLEQIWGKLDSASQKVIANSYSESSVEVLMQPADARSDIYSLAATLYHLVTARKPVDALERSIELLEGNADPLPIPSKLNPNIPPEVSYVLMKALDIKRENRFESASMMRQVLRTAVVRVKEREAKEGKQAEVPAPMIPLAEQKPVVAATTEAIHTTADAEADLNRQLEQIQSRLREAEAQKLKAEERAANAEKRLREKEAHEVVAYSAPDDVQVLDIPLAMPAMPAANNRKKAAKEEVVQVLDIPLTTPEVKEKAKPAPAAQKAEKEFEFSYAEEAKEKSSMPKVLAAAAAVLVLALGGFGAWTMMNFGSAQTVRPAATQSESKTETSAPSTSAENVPSAADTQSAASTLEVRPQDNAGQVLTEQPGQAERKANAVQIAAQKEKDKKPAAQPAAPAKAAPTQKKPVTVDDLINDN